MEVMLAMTIMTLISLGVAAGLSAAVRAWERGERNLDMYQRKRIIYERLFREIGGAINLRGQTEEDDGRRMIFNGEADSLSFITTSESITHPGKSMGIKESFIRVEPGEGLIVSEVMFSNQDFFNRDKGVSYCLDPDVREITFRYFYYPKPRRNTDEEPTEGEWLDSWGPDQVEISETVEEEDDGTRIMNRELKMNLPLAVEATLIVWDPDTDEVITWQPLIIPLKEARVLGVSVKRRPKVR
jgi:hypothetical protein